MCNRMQNLKQYISDFGLRMREKMSRREHKCAMDIVLLQKLPSFVSDTWLADSAKTIAFLLLTLLGLSVLRMLGVCTAWSCL